MAEFRAATGVPNLVGDYRKISEPLAKIVFGDKDGEKILRLAEVLYSHPRADEFDFIRSEHALYEILPKGVNKGSVIPKLAEHLHVDMKRTVAVGDYNNDIPMLISAGIGIAVSNACDAAKAAADMITVSNEEHAIAKIIYDIESGAISL
jgi:hydroxymethylpyrimidine pyrophosphatase-like HAD family hydrolase